MVFAPVRKAPTIGKMSWFDTSGLANIAKSALKEAQRTIDKALDIRDDVGAVPTNTPVDPGSDDFFGSWGLSPTMSESRVGTHQDDAITHSPSKSKMATSLWGSFTGSFFDVPKEKSARDSADSLDDSVDLNTEQFSRSKLVVQHSDDGEGGASRLSLSVIESIFENKSNVDVSFEDMDVGLNDGGNATRDVNTCNRLSIVSCESDKRSSESVEVLSGTECTTSPDSDALSIGQSISTASSGVKQTSESVEIVLESLTSPSSVEILESESLSSRRQSEYTDEFVSPLQSPEDNLSIPEKTSPDSVEIIPEEVEENSVAEDTMSYTSISESTAATVLDSIQNLHVKQKATKFENESVEPITRAPSRTALHLPISQISLINTQPQSTKENMSSLLKTSNVIDIPQAAQSESLIESNDEGSQSDKTLIASDSVMESSSDTSTTTESGNSAYLKNMLADAMVEKIDASQNIAKPEQKSSFETPALQTNLVVREPSPLSSESRSDLVKISSDETSGHTSGDELETTTSSDIEIISSPNGDSSSTHSRHSPSKFTIVKNKMGETNVDVLLGKMTFKKIKGHNRELSEASSVSDDSELERLVKRISEITEILELRETKLVEISRRNVELQETNADLKRQLDVVRDKQIESADLSQVTEEYTQRLSALERKFQQAIREKDTLRKQLDQHRQETTQKFTDETKLEEKDEIIKELRDEGEKLSKQQLQHSNIIKKLRSKEKEQESLIKHLKDSVDDLTSETDRLKRSLAAKEEVERSQIEAVHQLTARNKKLESEMHQMRGKLDDLTQKHETVRKSLDGAKKELIDKNKASTELVAREQLLQSLENEKRMTESQNEEIINQLEDLRLKLREAEQECLKKEQALRSENNELLRRLEDAERRNEEYAHSVMEVSKPLVRQLESLQATHNMKMVNFEQIEQGMLVKIHDLQTKLQSFADVERHIREENTSMKSTLSNLELRLSASLHEAEILKVKLDQQKTEKLLTEEELKRQIVTLQEHIKNENETITALKLEIYELKQPKCANKSEKLQEEIPEKSDPGPADSASTGNISPTLSLGRISRSESLASSLWLQDDSFDTGPLTRCTNMLEMQLLQTNLKQRDGEVQQLQWELNRREHERTILNTEISNLLSRIEALEIDVSAYASLKVQFAELQQTYDTLCQLYGEKVEETEELKLDLLDVKEMYKSQIDELLKQQKSNNS